MEPKIFYTKPLFENSKITIKLYNDGSLIIDGDGINLKYSSKDNEQYLIYFAFLIQEYGREYSDSFKLLVKDHETGEIFRVVKVTGIMNVDLPEIGLSKGHFRLNNYTFYQEISEETFQEKFINSPAKYKLFSSFEELDNYHEDKNKYINAMLKFQKKIIANKKENESIVTDPTIFQNQYIETYEKLYQAIKETIDKSLISGKNPLIVIGEQHYLPDASADELIALIICQQLGIKCLMIEHSENTIHNSAESKFETILDYNNNDGWALLQDFAYKLLHWNIIPIDPHHEQHNPTTDFSFQDYIEGNSCGWLLRTLGINNAISEINQPALLIVGKNHLKHICEDEAINSMYELLPINLVVNNHVDDKVNNKSDEESNKLLQKVYEIELDNELYRELSNNLNDDDLSLKIQMYINEKKLDGYYMKCSQEFFNSDKVLQIPEILNKNLDISLVQACKLAFNAALFHFQNSESSEDMSLLGDFFSGKPFSTEEAFDSMAAAA